MMKLIILEVIPFQDQDLEDVQSVHSPLVDNNGHIHQELYIGGINIHLDSQYIHSYNHHQMFQSCHPQYQHSMELHK